MEKKLELVAMKNIGFLAIQSLDSLNDQIIQYIFTPKDVDINLEKELSPREQETLRSSMLLIRRLLMDAQGKFRKMVEDNKQLAARIDGSIHAANQEVNALRVELADTNKRLTEISSGSVKNDGSVQTENECKAPAFISEQEATFLKKEKTQLEEQVKNLAQQLEELKPIKIHQKTGFGELKLELIQTKQELNRAKEALLALKADRKRLKAEKLDLLNQMKQLYGALEDKEAELRDFIQNYEHRMKESIKKLASEKEESEREKWEIIKKARDAAERSVYLRDQLDSREYQMKKLELDITELKEQVGSPTVKLDYTSEVFRKSPCPDSNQLNDELPPYETPPTFANSVTEDTSFKASINTPEHNLSDSFSPLRSVAHSSQDLNDNDIKRQKKKKNLGSLSRIFGKSRSRRSIAAPSESEMEDTGKCGLRVSLLNQDNYEEKLQLVEQSKGIHLSHWKANQVLAWLEIVLSMSIYGKMSSENVKSGKVLLGLSDSELSSALGITKPMHRRKLRLAIEEQRDPSEVKFVKASLIDHTWVSHRWIPDLGLSQYKLIFESQLVDGRILNMLTKKDLEKHFGIHRKFHQASLLHAVELLRRLSFDKDVLTDRRAKCEDVHSDPLVWTNQRVIKWVKSVDLEEYAENLRESGVHGALIVLEPSFNVDILATALGIPPSKSYVRRHLATELDSLIKPARAALETGGNSKRKSNGGSLGRSFMKSFRSGAIVDETPKSRHSIRDSIGRAFGKKVREDGKDLLDPETPKLKISHPIQNTPLPNERLLASTTV